MQSFGGPQRSGGFGADVVGNNRINTFGLNKKRGDANADLYNMFGFQQN